MGPRHGLSGAVGWCSLAFVLATLGAQLASQATAGSWRFERAAFEAGAWWQLFSSQWVHLTPAHGALNVAILVLLLFAFADRVALPVQGAALLGGYAGVAAVIAWDPGCAYYAGASGALHGFWAGNALGLGVAPHGQPGATRRVRAWGWMGLLALALKLGVQHAGADASAPGWLGFPTYHPAHAAGAAGGMVAVLLCLGLRCRWRSRSA